MDAYVRGVLQQSVAGMLLDSGFQEVEPAALDWLVDLAAASLERAGQVANQYAEHSQRTIVFRAHFYTTIKFYPQKFRSHNYVHSRL